MVNSFAPISKGQDIAELTRLVRELVDEQRELVQRLDRLEKTFCSSITKEAYTTEESAERLGRSEWTVRQWCNRGQVPGAKKVRGRGRKGEWRIPHEDLLRLQNEGPAPVTRRAS